MDMVRRFTPMIEQISLDECFLDVTGSTRLFGDVVQIARDIKKKIYDEEQLTASAGVAPNKFLAKIASDLEKPDGLVVVNLGEEEDFLRDLSVSKIWGIGKVMDKALDSLGIRKIGQLAELSSEFLHRKFGKQGDLLYQLSRGIDERPVASLSKAKSVGHEETYGKDIYVKQEIQKRLLSLSEAVGFRLRQNNLSSRTVTLKARYPDFTTVTRSRTLVSDIDDDLSIFYNILELLEKTDVYRKGARLLGVHTSNLSHPDTFSQITLFSKNRDRTKTLSKTIDSIRKRYGKEAIIRARFRL
jgi:DNA polymerase-4